MKQADLFATDDADRGALSDVQADAVVARLEGRLAQLQAATTFPWLNPLDAVHEENRFERDVALLGSRGEALWARFDKEMDRLHASRHADGLDRS